MQLLFRVLASCAVISAVPILLQARLAMRSTTLTTAWRWAVVAMILWVCIWGGTIATGEITGPWADQLWYAVSVGLLCPPIAVLGARRPGSRVWNWFVLAPLVLVLGLPVATAWNRDFEIVSLHVETPFLLGHLLVLVMGAGNFLGTRFTVAALLFGSALLAFLATFAGYAEQFVADHRDSYRMAGSLLLASSAWAARRAVRTGSLPLGFDRVWNDFRDSFGIVWARRIQDRINDTARKENWPARLELYGFHWTVSTADSPERAAANHQIEHTLRWLLRRFVDPDWIDARLEKKESVG